MTLKDFLPAVIGGITGIILAIITWKLKISTDERLRLLALDKEWREEKKELYLSVFSLFENAIHEILSEQNLNLREEFSGTNAKIHLLAPQQIVEQYMRAAAHLEKWSAL